MPSAPRLPTTPRAVAPGRPPEAPSVTTIYLHHILAAAREAGLDAGALASRAELDDAPEAALEARAPLERLLSLWEAVVERSRDAAFPLTAARRSQGDARSLLTFLCSAQPSMGHAIERFVRYSSMVTGAYAWSLRDDGDALTLVSAPRVAADRPGFRCAIEYDVADLVLILAACTGGRFAPLEVAFAHEAPAGARRFREALGLAPRFGASATAITVPRAALGVRPASANPGLAAILEQQVEQLSTRDPVPVSVAARLRSLLEANLPVRRVSAEGAARALSLSTRTLARRLEDEGTSYRALLEEVRFDLAQRWLGGARAREVAERLGYSDARAFRRAFHRWAGQSPRAYRGG